MGLNINAFVCGILSTSYNNRGVTHHCLNIICDNDTLSSPCMRWSHTCPALTEVKPSDLSIVSKTQVNHVLILVDLYDDPAAD